MITWAIKRAFENARAKNWKKMYWAFDIHETMIKPNWSVDEIPTDFYEGAKEALQLISKRNDIVRILFTCSHPSEIKKYLEFFESNEIYFDYVNENPEVKNLKYGNYDKKPYFNVLFEDKAGFNPEADWFKVMDLINGNIRI